VDAPALARGEVAERALEEARGDRAVAVVCAPVEAIWDRVVQISIVKPTGLPASTGEESAVLISFRSGQSTATESPAWALPSFDVVTEASLSTSPQLSLVVGLTMCTCTLAPEARSAGP
jgi:hypothetical protein